MPAASRRSKREPQEDIEETADNSGKSNAKSSKKSKQPTKRQVGSDDEDSDMDGDGDEGHNDDIIDVDSFGDQPIRHADARRLQVFVDEWSQTMKLLGPHASNLGAIGVDVADAATSEKDKKVRASVLGVNTDIL